MGPVGSAEFVAERASGNTEAVAPLADFLRKHAPHEDRIFQSVSEDFAGSGSEVTPDQETAWNNDNQIASDDTGTCSSCGNLTFRPAGNTPTGRKKRIPKYCDDCGRGKTRTTPRQDSPSRQTRTLSKDLREIQDGLAQQLTLLGMLAGPVMPVTGYVMCDRADRFATAAVKLASKNPRILALMRTASNGGPLLELLTFALGIGLAAGIDTGRINVERVPVHAMAFLGIKDALEAMTVSADGVASQNGKPHGGIPTPAAASYIRFPTES
jgi:hypothetical protein